MEVYVIVLYAVVLAVVFLALIHQMWVNKQNDYQMKMVIITIEAVADGRLSFVRTDDGNIAVKELRHAK